MSEDMTNMMKQVEDLENKILDNDTEIAKKSKKNSEKETKLNTTIKP